ncbi:MAG: sigma-70 family RNA polymerase sigma factor [Verrucomicrobiota bacterium]
MSPNPQWVYPSVSFYCVKWPGCDNQEQSLKNHQPAPKHSDGDFEAFGKLVEEHQSMVRAFITARIDDPFEAQDIAQETFLIAYRKLPELDQSRPLRPWLCTIAANLIRNHRRKRRAFPVGGSSDTVLELLDSEIESLPQKWSDSEVGAALKICLGKLEENARRLIQLRYEEGMGIAEIRRSLGGKHSAMTMKLHRLREQLRGCIENRMNQEMANG